MSERSERIEECATAVLAEWSVEGDVPHELWALLRRALSQPREPTPSPAAGEGGPCVKCGTPFDASADDIVWDSQRHHIGVAACRVCDFPALVDMDVDAEPTPSPAEPLITTDDAERARYALGEDAYKGTVSGADGVVRSWAERVADVEKRKP